MPVSTIHRQAKHAAKAQERAESHEHSLAASWGLLAPPSALSEERRGKTQVHESNTHRAMTLLFIYSLASSFFSESPKA